PFSLTHLEMRPENFSIRPCKVFCPKRDFRDVYITLNGPARGTLKPDGSFLFDKGALTLQINTRVDGDRVSAAVTNKKPAPGTLDIDKGTFAFDFTFNSDADVGVHLVGTIAHSPPVAVITPSAQTYECGADIRLSGQDSYAPDGD